MNYEYVLMEKKEGIATITLNRPQRLNAWIPPMRVEVKNCIEDAGEDPNVRVLIVTGTGSGFCVGEEAGTVAAGPETDENDAARQRLMLPIGTPQLVQILRSLNKPTIAAVNGITAGGGTTFAMACDVIIASEQARFRVASTRLGNIAEGLTWLMARAIGTYRAMELACTNDVIDAKEMERIGLVNKVVPHDDLMKTAKEMAKKMIQIPPLTLAMTKKSIYHSLGAHSLEEQIVFERAAMSAIRDTEDSKEARRSFIEKREPVYKGR